MSTDEGRWLEGLDERTDYERMTAAPPTLTDFLLARIAEDERWVDEETFPQPWHMEASRVLADCEAKRRIVEDFQEMTALPKLRANSVAAQGYAFALERVLQLLALPYADHPDYREEWKP